MSGSLGGHKSLCFKAMVLGTLLRPWQPDAIAPLGLKELLGKQSEPSRKDRSFPGKPPSADSMLGWGAGPCVGLLWDIWAPFKAWRSATLSRVAVLQRDTSGSA